jgi:hypothetical protein
MSRPYLRIRPRLPLHTRLPNTRARARGRGEQGARRGKVCRGSCQGDGGLVWCVGTHQRRAPVEWSLGCVLCVSGMALPQKRSERWGGQYCAWHSWDARVLEPPRQVRAARASSECITGRRGGHGSTPAQGVQPSCAWRYREGVQAYEATTCCAELFELCT